MRSARGVIRILSALLLAGFFSPTVAEDGRLPRPTFPLTVSADASGNLVLGWTAPDRQVPRLRTLLRSTTDLRVTKDAMAFPIAFLDANATPSSYRDVRAPQGVDLSYQLKLVYADGRTAYSTVAFANVTPPKLRPPVEPSIYIDKSGYTLTLLDRGEPLRRFPIALGTNPVNRKIHYDRASTPEGVYRIKGVQPQATYYRAYDLDYPNEVDRARYNVLAEYGDLPNPAPQIGGEIQIHGEGIANNWTWGCIAMRDSDMDLLFSLPQIRSGTPVLISGAELTLDDLDSALSLTDSERALFVDHLVQEGIASGRSLKHWMYGLCKFQSQHGLLVTGVLDRSTRAVLERQLRLSGSSR